MKSLKKISLESISETLSDNELKSITGGYSCSFYGCGTCMTCHCEFPWFSFDLCSNHPIPPYDCKGEYLCDFNGFYIYDDPRNPVWL